MMNLKKLAITFSIWLIATAVSYSHGLSNVEGAFTIQPSNASPGETVKIEVTLRETISGLLTNAKLLLKVEARDNNEEYNLERSSYTSFSGVFPASEGKHILKFKLFRDSINEIAFNGFWVSENGIGLSKKDSELWFVPMGKYEPIPWLDHFSGIIVGIVSIVILIILLKRRTPVVSFPKANWILLASAFASLIMPYGAYWDISFHSESGRESFLQPPHLMIYGGILICMAIVIYSVVRRPGNIPLKKYLKEDKVVAVALTALALQLISAPFDEIWHNLFGLDVSIWSPPHVLLIFGGVTVSFALSAMSVSSNNLATNCARLLILSGGLLICEVFLAEFEFPLPQWHSSQDRPYIVYPLLMLLFALIASVVSKQRVMFRFAASFTILTFIVMRLLIHPFLLMVERDVIPEFPVWMPLLIIPAAAMDLLMTGERKSNTLHIANK
jgi:hypothetical protein